MKKLTLFLAVTLLVSAETVRAHCPLCTLGAAAAAGGAALLGVSSTVIGLFIGAFAVSTGWWIARMIKKQLIPFQKTGIVVFSYAATVIPMLTLFPDIRPLYIPRMGQYGSTFVLNIFLIGSLLGGFIVAITPQISKKIGDLRNGRMVPYQGIVLTLSLLLIAGVLIQFMS